MTFKERAARVRELNAERAHALTVKWTGVIERCDRELAALMDEHVEACRRSRPIRIPGEVELIEGLHRAADRACERGDFNAEAEYREQIRARNRPYRAKRRGSVLLEKGS
jgi:hypothetical protein